MVSLSLGLKERIVKVLVWSVVLYGSETWKLRQEDIRSLEAFEMWMMDLATNDADSLDTACIQWADIRNGGWKSLLAGNFEKTAVKLDWACLKTRLIITEGHRRKVPGKENPWRPRAMLLDALMQEDEESEIDYAKLKEKAHDRETWRHWERTCLWAENAGPEMAVRWLNVHVYAGSTPSHKN